MTELTEPAMTLNCCKKHSGQHTRWIEAGKKNPKLHPAFLHDDFCSDVDEPHPGFQFSDDSEPLHVRDGEIGITAGGIDAIAMTDSGLARIKQLENQLSVARGVLIEVSKTLQHERMNTPNYASGHDAGVREVLRELASIGESEDSVMIALAELRGKYPS